MTNHNSCLNIIQWALVDVFFIKFQLGGCDGKWTIAYVQERLLAKINLLQLDIDEGLTKVADIYAVSPVPKYPSTYYMIAVQVPLAIAAATKCWRASLTVDRKV